jgi:hypothetical protein
MAERKARNPRNLKDDGVTEPKSVLPGRPVNAEKPAEVKGGKQIEILMLTPSGRLDKKTYEIYEKYVTKEDGTKALKGKYRKLVKIEKGVRG